MTRAIGLRPALTGGSGYGAWVVLLACWATAGGLRLLWLAARLAAALTTGQVPPFGQQWVSDLLHGRTDRTWPHTPTPAVATCAITLLAVAAVLIAVMWRLTLARIPAPGDPLHALAGRGELAGLTQAATAARAARLRPGLGRRAEPGDIGLPLGELARPRGRGPRLYAGWEDTLLAVMAPRSGKTTALAIPYVLSAPGPVIATSNKADLWAATATPRRHRPGATVWLFDPHAITHQPQQWWWNPLHRLDSVDAAHRLAGHFVLTIDDGQKRDLWGPAAQDLLTALFLAAAATGRTLRHVAAWLDDPAVPTPAELLHTAGHPLIASSLRGAQNGATETRDGIYQTARTAAKALRDEQIITWITPPPCGTTLPALDPAAFTRSSGTLYLLSKSRAAAAPLVAALTDTVIRAAEHQAERAGGRLDPPLVVVLDEAANICRIADLPELYSHLGSRGITPVTILQSYEQGTTVWGEPGMAALWGAATRKLIGAGLDSPRLTRDIAALTGQHDVPVRSITHADGRTSEQISLRLQDVLHPADIRALPPGTALLLATGTRPALIHLTPWYTTPHAPAITEAIHAAEHAITTAAQAKDPT